MPIADEHPWRWFDFGETGVHVEWMGRTRSGCRLIGAVRVFERVPVSLPWEFDAETGQPWTDIGFTWSCVIFWDGFSTIEVKLVDRRLPLSRLRLLHKAARRLAARRLLAERWIFPRRHKRQLVVTL